MIRSDDSEELRAALNQIRHRLSDQLSCSDESMKDEIRRLLANNQEVIDSINSQSRIGQEPKSGSPTVKAQLKVYHRKGRRENSVREGYSEEAALSNRAEMLLHFGLPKRDRECMIGDLEEEYRRVILPKYGPRVAARWYWWQTVRSVIAASGGRVRVWLSFGGLARAAGWIVEKFTL